MAGFIADERGRPRRRNTSSGGHGGAVVDSRVQAPFLQCFEWRLAGARPPSAGDGPMIAVVVDVLSFTTTASVALDLGITVLPYRWADASATDFAWTHDATLAVGRSVTKSCEISLSPRSLRQGVPTARLVLPSPDGSTIAAGERWSDGSLRPAAEELWGAGAVLFHLPEHGWSDRSPDAGSAAAAAACTSNRGDEGAALACCVSGRELIDAGYRADVELAAEVGRSRSVPLLRDHRFTSA